jgi:hypothetical protein
LMRATEDAWLQYRTDKLTDPARRYINDDREIFEAGWVAAQKRHPAPYKESVWVPAPTAIDDDPE